MKDDVFSSFESPEFKELLKKYEEMMHQHTSAYFDSDELTSIAEYYANKEMMAESDKAIEYALQLHPDDTDAMLFRCSNLITEGRYDEAEMLLDAFPDADDNEALFLRGTIMVERRMAGEAESIFSRLADKEEEDDKTGLLLDIGETYLNAGYRKHAYKWLKKAYRLSPADYRVWESMGMYYLNAGNLDKYIYYMNRLLDEDPYEITYWTNLARAYLEQGYVEKASEAIDFAATVDSESPIVTELKGFLSLQTGDTERARELFMQIEHSHPSRQHIWRALSECYFTERNYGKALEYLDKVIASTEIPSRRADLFQRKAVCCLLADNLELCKQSIDEGLKCDGRFAQLYVTTAEYYIHLEQMQKAREAFRKAEELASDKGDFIEETAELLFRYSLTDEALGYFQRMEKEYPERIKKYYYHLAYCYYMRKDTNNGINALIAGIIYQPDLLRHADQNGLSSLMTPDFIKSGLAIKRMIDNGTLEILEEPDDLNE